jgi:hypothetical protein
MHESSEMEGEGDSSNNHYAIIVLATVSAYQKVSIWFISWTTLKECVHILVFFLELYERGDKFFWLQVQLSMRRRAFHDS